MFKLIRFLLFISCLFIPLALAANPASSRLQPIYWPEADFWSLVKETQATVGAITNLEENGSRLALNELAEKWQSVSGIILKNGERIPLNPEYFVSQLLNEPPPLNQLAAEMDALYSSRQIRLPVRTGNEQARLKEILSQPQFQWTAQEPNPLQILLADLYRRFMALLSSLLENQLIVASAPFLKTGLIILGVGLVIFAVWYGIRTFLRSVVSDTNLADEAAGDEFMSAEAALQKAGFLSEEGDYRSAVRYLYLSTLLLLEERSLLRYDRSKTNREYLRSLSQQPHLAALFVDVVDVFDRVWYGFHPLEEPEYRIYAQRVDELRRQK